MRPILFEIFEVPFASWYVFFALAALGGYALAFLLLRALRNEALLREMPALFLAAYLAGWLGARLLGLLTEEPPSHSFSEFISRLFSFGPMSFFGGFIGGALAVLLLVFVRRLDGWRLADVLVPGVLVGLALGRVGCFLNGCDYGRPLPHGAGSPWWAPAVHVLDDHLPRYPTQLEEAAAVLLLATAGGVMLFKGRPRALTGRAGVTGLLLLGAMAFHRFLNEFFRGDSRPMLGSGPFSLLQVVALLVASASLSLALWRLRTPLEPETGFRP